MMRVFLYNLLISVSLLVVPFQQGFTPYPHNTQVSAKKNVDLERGGQLAAYYITSNNNLISAFKAVLKKELPSEIRQKVTAGIKALESTNVTLKAIQKKLQSEQLQKAEIQKLVSEAIRVEYNNAVVKNIVATRKPSKLEDDIVIIGGVAIPVIPGIIDPGENCDAAGDRVQQDCLGGLDILFKCGLISSADKVLGKFTCQFAGVAEKNNCEISNMQGNSHQTTETSLSLEAEIQCRAFKESGGVGNPLQTQTSEGN